VTRDRDDEFQREEPAWHERTSTVVGASLGALAAIGVLWFAISYLTGGSDAPSPAAPYLPEPSSWDSSTSSTTPTTSTETITSTSPPLTTDINPGDTSTTPSTSTETTTSYNPSNLPHTRTPSTYDDGRNRPRFNETRTLYPRPQG
jgi:hypothetical protein